MVREEIVVDHTTRGTKEPVICLGQYRLLLLFDGFTLITRGFDHFEIRQREALVERVDAGDQLRGHINPPMVGHGQNPLMRAAMVVSLSCDLLTRNRI